MIKSPDNAIIRGWGQGGRERAGSGITGAGSGIYMKAWSGSRNKEGDSLLFTIGSWDSMTHDTRTAVAVENLRQRKRFRVIQVKTSKTILTGLTIFRCGNENSVHGRPSWELASYDCTSQITEDFALWCKLASKECGFNERTGECGA